MSRDEFTKTWWNWCVEHNAWYKNQQLSLNQAGVYWWFTCWVPNNWHLSRKGFEQLDRYPFEQHRVHQWECCILNNSHLVLELSKLQCPWDVDTDRINGQQHVVSLWLYGEQENMWMSLCGGDVWHFLNTWNR